MIRRLKKDVLLELPPKVRQRIMIEIPKKKRKELEKLLKESKDIEKSLNKFKYSGDQDFTSKLDLQSKSKLVKLVKKKLI